jgi:hypothetical protein
LWAVKVSFRSEFREEYIQELGMEKIKVYKEEIPYLILNINA